MFKLMKDATYWWPVTVAQPSQETPGEMAEGTFEVRFKRLGVDDHNALMDRVVPEKMTDRAFCKEVAVEFRGVSDQEGNEFEFTPANFDLFLQEPDVSTAIAQAYIDSAKKAGEKNSSRPPAPGPAAAS